MSPKSAAKAKESKKVEESQKAQKSKKVANDDEEFEWCEEEKVSPSLFAELWKGQYAPQLRVVKAIPEGLLSIEESTRLKSLRREDPDDIPSVTLALVLEGIYLSTDRAAAKAVYGVELSYEELSTWLEVLRAGGDAGVLGATFEGCAMLASLAGAGAWSVFDKLTGNLHPWLRMALVGLGIAGGAHLYRRVPDEHREKYRNVLGDLIRFIEVVGVEYVKAVARLSEAYPTVPAWLELAGTQERSHVLIRCCLHTLSRSKSSHLSAVELADRLPRLGVAQSSPKVREVLRSHPGCFEQVYAGRWQVGTALVREVAPSN